MRISTGCADGLSWSACAPRRKSTNEACKLGDAPTCVSLANLIRKRDPAAADALKERACELNQRMCGK